MGTTSEKLNKILSTKEAIKTAIINKGVAVQESDTFASYASKISSIPSGSIKPIDYLYGVFNQYNTLSSRIELIMISAVNNDPYINTYSGNPNDTYFVFSDGSVTFSKIVTHQWDTSQDIDLGGQFKYRWVLCVYGEGSIYGIGLPLATTHIIISNVARGNNAFKDLKYLEELHFINNTTFLPTSWSWSFILGDGRLNVLKGVNCGIATNLSNAFSAESLTTVENISNINVAILFESKFLTKQSLLNILNALKDNTGNPTLTCTLRAENLAKLSTQEKAIATNKNWTLA